jgi:hypothetical protein
VVRRPNEWLPDDTGQNDSRQHPGEAVARDDADELLARHIHAADRQRLQADKESTESK